MKVELDVYKNDLINFAINTLTTGEENCSSLIKEALNEETGNFDFDIELKINGQEFDFMKILDRLVNRQNEIVEKEVKKVLIEKFYNIQKMTDNIIENLEILDIDIEERV